ncbi:RusA family crossover junction endodeoxyribonuclease [Streptomyces sp. NPDC056192]|uniref:RusA family crossover junction endodeoxyribonuclease n=1 Tax=Streptomyces sp. NPDC056192 TaxID=3345743 RepID=UPI0035D86B85
MTLTNETFNVYLAGEQINESLGLGYIYITTPLGDVRMTAEEADRLGSALQYAADTDRRMNLSDTEAANPYLDPYPWSAEPALTVTVYGLAGPQGSKTAVGYGRSRKTGRAIPLMRESSAKVKPWREKVTAAIEAALLTGEAQYLAGPVRADITFTMPKPGSAPKRRRTYPAVTPDIDKLERSTYDAITKANAWEDDGRVIENHNRKVYPGEHPDALDQPGAIIRLYTLGDPS